MITVAASSAPVVSGRCEVAAAGIVATSISVAMSPVSRVTGPMTNWALSPVSTPLTGTSADDVTAAAENTYCYSICGGCLTCEVSLSVADETGGLITSVIPIATVVSSLTVPASGSTGFHTWLTLTNVLAGTSTLSTTVSMAMLRSVPWSSVCYHEC